MKRVRATIITIALVPFLLIYSLAPRVNLNFLGELLSRQPIEVYSFVWVPLLEISMLITQKVFPPEAITPPLAAQDSNQGKTSNPAKGDSYIFFIIPTGILIATLRRILLPLVAFLQAFCFKDIADDPAWTYLLLPLPSLRLIPILRSNPALPRGDPLLPVPKASW